MKVENPSRIICDSCGQAQVETEEAAARSGWLIDYRSHPHIHVCAACQRAALGR
jgi:hypothetical protein